MSAAKAMGRRKGIFTIMTTFFFILVVLVVALGVIYYSNVMAALNIKANVGTNDLIVARNFRDSMYSCYGSVMSDGLLSSGACKGSGSLNVTGGLVKGWRVMRDGLNNCTSASWGIADESVVAGQYRNRMVYAVPVLEGGKDVCLGFLEVYI
jgi:hypothetical protein